MSYKITSATKKIHALNKRIRIVQGGTSAGKTIGILEVLIDLCQRDETPTLTSIVSETFPHLKRGAIKDFLDILEIQGYFKPERWNKTDFTYTFETGSRLEFFSADQPGKVRGPRRERLFLNEANNISFETFEQLEVRTSQIIFIDYNPVGSFWAHENLIDKRTDTDFIILTYKDNEALDKAIVDSIEQRKSRPGWWQVYGLGLIGEVEGKIFNNWQIIDDIPFEARLERYGLDFGYTNDPTAIVAVYYYNGGYIWDEVLFGKGLSNKQIAETLLNQPRKAMIIADSAEPKSIDELRAYQLNVQPTTKGPGSVLQRIQMTQDQNISVTKRSVNIIKEYRNYLWETDNDGRVLNVPEHLWSHSMDAGTYAMASLVPMLQRKDMIANMPRYVDTRTRKNPAR